METRRGPILFDAGTGLSRLADPLFREMVGRSNRALILLGSCAHGRVAGLPWIPAFLGGLAVTVAGPPGSSDVLARLLDRPFLPEGMEAWRAPLSSLEVVELKPGMNPVGREKVEVSVLDGPEPSCAFRVREVVYAAGCPARQETATLAARASLLIHDASLDGKDLESDPSDGERRSTAAAAARLAGEAQVQDLLLAHVNPTYEPGRVERLQFEATSLFPRTVVGTDMACLKLTGVPEEEPEDGESAPDGSSTSSEDAGETSEAPAEDEGEDVPAGSSVLGDDSLVEAPEEASDGSPSGGRPATDATA